MRSCESSNEPQAGRSPGRPLKSKIGLVLVNGPSTSVQGPRARALFGDQAPIQYKSGGRIGSIGATWSALRRVREGWIYGIDLGVPSAPLAALRRRIGRSVRLAFEIGDPIRPLLRGQGRAGWQVTLAHQLDRRLPSKADRLVFRGSYLANYFAEVATRRPLPRSIWLPDGVDVARFRPRRDGDPEAARLRRTHGLVGRFVVGLVGNIHFNAIHNLFYGWELAEALALLPGELPITGVVVGDGPGFSVLEASRERLGLGERLRLVGRVPHEEVPAWLNLFDVALSTQTDDPVGWGRTTAKLPESLACGTPVLCTDVGEAHRWLKESGQTLAYQGYRDESYPARLAQRLREWLEADLEPIRQHNRELALRLFDYEVLRQQLDEFLSAD